MVGPDHLLIGADLKIDTGSNEVGWNRGLVCMNSSSRYGWANEDQSRPNYVKSKVINLCNITLESRIYRLPVHPTDAAFHAVAVDVGISPKFGLCALPFSFPWPCLQPTCVSIDFRWVEHHSIRILKTLTLDSDDNTHSGRLRTSEGFRFPGGARVRIGQ